MGMSGGVEAPPMFIESHKESHVKAFLVVGVLLVIAGCNWVQGHTQDSAQGPVLGAEASASPRPSLDPDLASGIVGRFYRDLDAKKSADIATILSPDFYRSHTSDWVADYGWIQNPKLQITSIRDRTVSYLVDYTYTGNNGLTLSWERTGKWTFNHGSERGWLLDKDTWDSLHLVGLSIKPGAPVIPVADVVYSDGHHTFDYDGDRYSFVTNKDGWRIADLGSTATPPPAFEPASDPYARAGAGTTYVPPNGGSSCDEATLQWKSENGDWIGTDDGLKYHVMGGDEPTVMGWTNADDLRICGDTIIDVDDSGSQVDIY